MVVPGVLLWAWRFQQLRTSDVNAITGTEGKMVRRERDRHMLTAGCNSCLFEKFYGHLSVLIMTASTSSTGQKRYLWRARRSTADLFFRNVSSLSSFVRPLVPSAPKLPSRASRLIAQFTRLPSASPPNFTRSRLKSYVGAELLNVSFIPVVISRRSSTTLRVRSRVAAGSWLKPSPSN